MNNEVNKYFNERKELLEMGKIIIEDVYDPILANYYNAYEKEEGNKAFLAIIQQYTDELEKNQTEALKGLTKIIVINSIVSILGRLFKMDTQFQLIYQKDEEIDIDIESLSNGELINIANMSDGFLGDMVGKNSWLDIFSKYGDGSEYLG